MSSLHGQSFNALKLQAREKQKSALILKVEHVYHNHKVIHAKNDSKKEKRKRPRGEYNVSLYIHTYKNQFD